MSEDGGITARERGETHFAIRGVARVFMVIAVVVLVVGVVLAGNFVHTGSLFPWVSAEAQSSAAVVGPAPAPSATDATADEPAAPQTPAERVAAEDARLSAVAALSSDDPALLATWNTVVLAPRSGQFTVYTGADLLALGALRPDDAMTSTLVRNVIVRAGAELDLVASYDGKPGTYRLLSTPDQTTSIVAWGGNVGIVGSADAPGIITSWDDTTGGPDLDESDGRAYIRARDGALALASVSLEHLGYWSGRTGGLSATGSGAGAVIAALNDVTVTGLHYGFFGSDTTTVGIVNSRFDGSAMTGIELTNGAADTTIQGTTVSDSGSDGIAVSRQSKNLTLTETTVEGSAGWGVRVDGAALASGPTTGGYGLTPATGFTLTDSRVQNNRDGGVRIISNDETEITGTTVDETRTAVLVEGPSTGLTVTNVDLSSEDLRALDITGEITDATVSDSRLAGRRIALELTQAAVVVSGNDISATSGYAVELAENARADITGNVFRGVGQDAVALWSGARSMQAGNDQSNWTFQWAWVGWMNEHPMMWMWALVLLLPAVGVPLLWRRRREHRRLRELLREALLRHGEQQVAAYRAPAGPDDSASASVPVPIAEAAARVTQTPAPVTAAPVTSAPAQTLTAPAAQDGVPTRPTRPVVAAARPAASARPRSFADLRTGVLEGRTFASLREFAVAAVVEGGYSVSTISRLFRIQHWRLQQWVDEVLPAETAPGEERR